MKRNSILLIFTAIFFTVQEGLTQDLLDILDEELKDTVQIAQATFKTTRLGFGHTVETRKKGVVQFTLGTRYWNIPMTEPRRSFVADRFTANFSIDYSLTDRFTLGTGYTTFDGFANLYGKYRLIRQQKGVNAKPFGLTIAQTATLLTREFGPIQLGDDFNDQLVFTTQAVIARKFNRDLSLQLVPTYIHSNRIQTHEEKDQFAMGFGGRYRLSNHTTLFSEYYYVFGREEERIRPGFNSFFLGVNWEIGYAIFQLSLSNTKSFDDAGAILYSLNNFNFNDGGLHFGVNVIYTLHTKKSK